jgi:hypothetical protein
MFVILHMPLAHLPDWCAYTSNNSPSGANVLLNKQGCVIKPEGPRAAHYALHTNLVLQGFLSMQADWTLPQFTLGLNKASLYIFLRREENRKIRQYMT